MTRKGNVSSGVLLIFPSSFTVWYSQTACVAVGDGEKRKGIWGGGGRGIGASATQATPKGTPVHMKRRLTPIQVGILIY